MNNVNFFFSEIFIFYLLEDEAVVKPTIQLIRDAMSIYVAMSIYAFVSLYRRAGKN